jgi:hypothetical protein
MGFIHVLLFWESFFEGFFLVLLFIYLFIRWNKGLFIIIYGFVLWLYFCWDEGYVYIDLLELVYFLRY